MAEKDLIVRIIGEASSLQRELGRSVAEIDGFSNRMSRIGASMSSAGAAMTRSLTLPIIGVAAASTKMAMDFGHAMELIHTQAGGSQTEVDKMSGAILRMVQQGKSFGQSAKEMAEGIFFIESTGIRGADALEVLRTAAAGAAVGQTSLANTSNALTSAMKVYGLSSAQAGGAMATLNAIVGAGKMHMEDLNAALGTKFLPVAKQMGFTLQEAGAAIDIFTAAGIPAQVAASNLATAFVKMETPTKAGITALKDMGVSAGQLHDAMGQGLPSVLELLSGKLEEFGRRGGDDIINAFGGARAGASVLALVQQYEGYMKDLGQVSKESSPATFWQLASETMQEPSEKIKSNIESLKASMITIGATIAPVAADIASWIGKVAQAFDNLSPTTKRWIEITAGVVAVIGPVVAVIGSLTAGVGLLAAALGFILSPIGLLVGGIALLAGGIALAVLAPTQLQSALEHLGLSAGASERVVKDLQLAWEELKRAGQLLADAIRNHWDQITSVVRGAVSVVEGIITGLRTFWSTFHSQIAAVAQGTWTAISGIVEGAVKIITGIVDVFAGVLHGDWARAWHGIKEIAAGAWHQVEGVVRGAIKVVGTLATSVAHAAVTALQKGWQLMGELAGLAWVGIKLIFADASGWFVGIGTAIMDGLGRGLISAAEGVYGKLRAIASKIKKLMSSLFGILSPSKDFAEIGDYLMQGLAVGVDRSSPEAVKSLQQAVANMKAAMDASRPEIEQAAQLLGVQATRGIVGGIVGVQQSTSSQIRSALIQSMQPALAQLADAPEIAQAAKLIGEKQTQAIVDGVVGKQVSMAQQLKDALSTAIQPALQLAAAEPAIEAAAKLIGEKQAQAVVDGVLGKKLSLTQQIKVALSSAVQEAAKAAQAAIVQARAGLTSALGSIGGSILSAFDVSHSGYVSPAQKLLDKMQLEDQANQYKSAVTDAMEAIGADKTAIQAAQAAAALAAQAESGTAMLAGQEVTQEQALASLATAHAQLLTDNEAHATAVRQLKEYNLGLEAQRQNEAHAATIAKQRESLAEQILNLRTELAKHPEEYAKIGHQIIATLKRFHVPMFTAGQKFASQFADGLTSQLTAVEKAAKALAEAVSKYVPKSPAKVGPLAFSSMDAGAKFGSEFSQGITRGLYAGAGMQGLASRILTPPPRPQAAFAGSSGGGAVVQHFSFPNYVGSKAELIDMVQSELVRAGMRDRVNGALGRYASGTGALAG